MKLCFVAFVFAALALALEGMKCKTGSECADDECCVIKKNSKLGRGKCFYFRREGQTCMGVEKITDRKYSGSCPCMTGLECVPEKHISKQTKAVEVIRKCRSSK